MVWNTLSGQLIGHINSHGMHDLCEHGWQGQFKPLPAYAVHPEWRYEGFYGLLRVTLEDGADWLVAVLAPLPQVALSLDERLRQFDPVKHGGEAMATTSVGAETW